MSSTKSVQTFCRICEPSCGLVARVEEGALVALAPDEEHPVTRGFACNKGLAGVDLHRDPDRCDFPQKRREGRRPVRAHLLGPGDRGDRGLAIREILDVGRAGRLRVVPGQPARLQRPGRAGDRFLPSSAGRAQELQLRDPGLREQVRRQRGRLRHVDLSSDPRLRTHGLPVGARVESPCLAHELRLDRGSRWRRLVGSDRSGREGPLREPARDGERTRARRDASSSSRTADVYLLAAMLDEILASSGRADATRSSPPMRRVSRSWPRSSPDYPAERVAPVVGLPAEEIRGLARDFADAPSSLGRPSRPGSTWGGREPWPTGSCRSSSSRPGNLDRRGGNRYGRGFYAGARSEWSDRSRRSISRTTAFGRVRQHPRLAPRAT